MTWDRDSLWAKACLFMERALDQSRDDPQFGLWCAMTLELLTKAAVASVSPALLAQADHNHKNLLHVIGRGDPKIGARTIGAAQTVRLCEYLFDEFNSEDSTAAIALLDRRNEELHTGAAAFAEYTTQRWIEGFYRCCQKLAAVLGESLENLFGPEEARIAAGVLEGAEKAVRQRVERKIEECRRSFMTLDEEARNERISVASERVKKLVFTKHHRVICPSCDAPATVEGEIFGVAKVSHDEDEAVVVVKQPVAPRYFECWACGLMLEGYAELSIAGVGDQYTRTTKFEPAEYFELINPDDVDAIQAAMADHAGFWEYDNE